MKKILLSLLTVASLASAGGCLLTQSDDMNVTWKAYKTLAKLGVEGKFTEVNYVANKKEGKNFKELLVGSKVSINLSKVDTKNKARDKTLVNNFFSKLKSKNIEGVIISIKANERVKGQPYTGNLDINLSMNSQTVTIPMNYKYIKETFTAIGTIDLFDFDANDALKSINKNCFDLHKGKTWNDVSIGFSTTIKASLCDAKIVKEKK